MKKKEGNTALLEYIAYKTQPFTKEYGLVFIPKNHKHIKQTIRICNALLEVKNTSTQDPKILNLVLKKTWPIYW